MFSETWSRGACLFPHNFHRVFGVGCYLLIQIRFSVPCFSLIFMLISILCFILFPGSSSCWLVGCSLLLFWALIVFGADLSLPFMLYNLISFLSHPDPPLSEGWLIFLAWEQSASSSPLMYLLNTLPWLRLPSWWYPYGWLLSPGCSV